MYQIAEVADNNQKANLAKFHVPPCGSLLSAVCDNRCAWTFATLAPSAECLDFLVYIHEATQFRSAHVMTEDTHWRIQIPKVLDRREMNRRTAERARTEAPKLEGGEVCMEGELVGAWEWALPLPRIFFCKLQCTYRKG